MTNNTKHPKDCPCGDCELPVRCNSWEEELLTKGKALFTWEGSTYSYVPKVPRNALEIVASDRNEAEAVQDG